MTTQQDLLKAMEQEPLLTDFGIGVFNGYRLSKDERRQRIEQERESLENNFEQFKICCDWLSLCKWRKTINPHWGSYGLKHLAEKYFDTYVTNGAFIAAVIYLEIPYRIIDDGPNIEVAISSKLPEATK